MLEPYADVPGARGAAEPRPWLAICSNWDWDLEPAVAEAGFGDAVDVVVSSAWAGRGSPTQDLPLDTRAARCRPAGTVFVGDTWGPDVEGPRRVGMTPVYLERDGHWPDTTAPAPDAVEASHVVRPATSTSCSNCSDRHAAPSALAGRWSDEANVLRLFALPAGTDVELDRLPFLQAPVPAALNRREVDEHIGPVLTRDEAVALLCVEPFHGSCCQRLAPFTSSAPAPDTRLCAAERVAGNVSE